LENPIIGFKQPTKGTFANPDIAGLIGTTLLSQFTVIYDNRRRRTIFEPNNSFVQASKPKNKASRGHIGSKIPFEMSDSGYIDC